MAVMSRRRRCRRLRRVRLADGEMLDRDALFFYVGWRLRSTSPARWAAGWATTAPSPSTQAKQRPSTASTQPGTAPTAGARFPAAAGSGVTAAVAINARLSFEDADRAVADSRAPAPASEAR